MYWNTTDQISHINLLVEKLQNSFNDMAASIRISILFIIYKLSISFLSNRYILFCYGFLRPMGLRYAPSQRRQMMKSWEETTHLSTCWDRRYSFTDNFVHHLSFGVFVCGLAVNSWSPKTRHRGRWERGRELSAAWSHNITGSSFYMYKQNSHQLLFFAFLCLPHDQPVSWSCSTNVCSTEPTSICFVYVGKA